VAPLLNGETLNGSNFSTNTNKVTVVNVWASWCAPCRAEAPILEDFAIKNPQIQFVGILTRDNLSAAQAFYQRFKITYPTFIDDSLINKFQGTIPANGIPTTLVIDKDGRVAARISGATTVANLQKVLESITGGVINA
jgi:thiol-disulfide isomerase/thioredoxin